MTMLRSLPAVPDRDEVAAMYRWWIDERTGWPLDRALRVWLSFEGQYEWDPEHEEAEYDRWFDAVMRHADDRSWK